LYIEIRPKIPEHHCHGNSCNNTHIHKCYPVMSDIPQQQMITKLPTNSSLFIQFTVPQYFFLSSILILGLPYMHWHHPSAHFFWGFKTSARFYSSPPFVVRILSISVRIAQHFYSEHTWSNSERGTSRISISSLAGHRWHLFIYFKMESLLEKQRGIVWLEWTDVSEVRIASISDDGGSTHLWNDDISQKALTFVLAAVRTRNPIYVFL
jgi:hypothetical protein